jgi:hypothetical protein
MTQRIGAVNLKYKYLAYVKFQKLNEQFYVSSTPLFELHGDVQAFCEEPDGFFSRPPTPSRLCQKGEKLIFHICPICSQVSNIE